MVGWDGGKVGGCSGHPQHCCCDDLQLASLCVHRCAILFASSGGTVGEILMGVLILTVGIEDLTRVVKR